MNIVTQVKDMQMISSLQSVGFVPTMGHLHNGHLSLVEHARNNNDYVVVSIFVNPTQFNNQQDLENYPRTLERDIEMLSAAGVDYLFLPQYDELYPDNYEIIVKETSVASILEGEYRPGHFDGVLTVVLKLLNIIRPTNAYFGKKDYQQYLLVEKMARALFLPVKIVGCETERGEGGLALSSRNSRLTENQKLRAEALSQQLYSTESVEQIRNNLKNLDFKIDYVEEKWGRRLAAVWLGDVRLIDNVEV